MLRVAFTGFFPLLSHLCQAAPATTRGHLPDKEEATLTKIYGSADEQASCVSDHDCPVGQYCDSHGACYDCNFVTKEMCDDVAGFGACCTATFKAQCPSNPHGCGAGGGCVFNSVDSKNFGQYLGWECPGPNGEGYTGGPSAVFEITYESLNSDSITAYAHWLAKTEATCAALPGDSDWEIMGRSGASHVRVRPNHIARSVGEVTFTTRLTNTLFKLNKPCVTLKCDNLLFNCIVKIVSGNITPITDGADSTEATIPSSTATLTEQHSSESIYTIPAGTSLPITA